jgi:hypothetical protein
MDDARELLAARLGVRPLRRVAGGGYTLMEHWLVELADETRAFAKVAVDEPTAGFLRDEHKVYSQVEASFLPELVGWDDDGERPILVLEDLTQGHWPPPWREGDVDAVIDALGAAAAMAVLLVVGRYVTHSLVVNALALQPPVASIFTGS